jgi:hypothetical protein
MNPNYSYVGGDEYHGQVKSFLGINTVPFKSQSILWMYENMEGVELIPFATTGLGDMFCFSKTTSQEVSLYSHESGETEYISGSFHEWLGQFSRSTIRSGSNPSPHMLVKLGMVEMIASRFTESWFDDRDELERSVLEFAIRARMLGCFKELLPRWTDWQSIHNTSGQTMLHLAVESQSVDFCRYILAQGAKINTQDNEGITPLILAIQCGAVRSALLFLEHGADISLQDEFGNTAIDYCQHGQVSQYVLPKLK